MASAPTGRHLCGEGAKPPVCALGRQHFFFFVSRHVTKKFVTCHEKIRDTCHDKIRDTLIAGTTPFWGGSLRHIWARDVAFLHFFQIASLRPRSAGKCIEEMWFVNISRTIVRSKGGGLGKMKKCDISGPNLPPGTTPKRGGSCDQNELSCSLSQLFCFKARARHLGARTAATTPAHLQRAVSASRKDLVRHRGTGAALAQHRSGL